MCDCGTKYDADWWHRGWDRNKALGAMFEANESIPEGQVMCPQCGEQYKEGEVHICETEENNERSTR